MHTPAEPALRDLARMLEVLGQQQQDLLQHQAHFESYMTGKLDLAGHKVYNQLDSPNTGVFSQLEVLPWVLGARRELAQRESIAMLKNVLFI